LIGPLVVLFWLEGRYYIIKSKGSRRLIELELYLLVILELTNKFNLKNIRNKHFKISAEVCFKYLVNIYVVLTGACAAGDQLTTTLELALAYLRRMFNPSSLEP
jgi:hypothetical protein